MPAPESTPPLNLRFSRRKAATSTVALLTPLVSGTARPVAALRGWCRSDPLIEIDGELADIFCTAPPRILTNVIGPTEIVVTVPPEVRARLILAGPGFGRGERVDFRASGRLRVTENGIEVGIKARVPAREELAIGLEFAPRIVGILNPDRAEGLTNEWVKLGTEF